MATLLTQSFLLSILLISTTPLLVSSGRCNKDDKKTLFAISDSFEVSNHFPAWTDQIACCDWDGIECEDTTGRVTGLDISEDIVIVGTIPTAIADLPFLQVLRLHKLPNLTGTIPPQLTKLQHLRFLTISWTSVYGPVPAFLSQLRALEQLDLSFNRLSGTIPPALGDLPSCYAIDISRNNLSGTIPDTLFHNTSSAPSNPDLTLSHNGLTGEIPKSFANVDFLQIDVSRNSLTGDAAFLFGRSKSLEQIDLSRNQLEFNLTGVEFPQINQLVSVYLHHNRIYGSIPDQIVNVTNFNFNFFNVSYNRLCGKIPTGGPMGQFDASCYIHNKCLCGTPLPPCK